MGQLIRQLLWLGLLLTALTAWGSDTCGRVVSQSPYITHQLRYLGLEHCIVGVSRYDPLPGRTRTGGIKDPDWAAIEALKPQLMLTSVWTAKAELPKTRTYQVHRLESFQSMQQIVQNLREISTATHQASGMAMAKAFERDWKRKALDVKANGRRALLLSSCTGQPYSFGKNTWLADLFVQAGFDVVEFETGVRHLARDQTATQVTQLIQKMNPEVVFVFTRQMGEACATVALPPNVPLVALNGAHFLHPAPVLLAGLDELLERRSEWQRNKHQ